MLPCGILLGSEREISKADFALDLGTDWKAFLGLIKIRRGLDAE
jgi:hypothetical protein